MEDGSISKSNSTLSKHMSSSIGKWNLPEVLQTPASLSFLTITLTNPLWVQVEFFRDTITVTEKIHQLWCFIAGHKSPSLSLDSGSCSFSFIPYVPTDSNEHHSTLLLSLAAWRGWEGRTEGRHCPLRFCSLAHEQRERIVRKLNAKLQAVALYTVGNVLNIKTGKWTISVPSGSQSSPWLVWKQRKDRNLPPSTAFFLHNKDKSNAHVPCGALNYLLNWQSFPHCCCCTNRHFLRRPWNCREVTQTAYCQLFTPYKCIVVGKMVLKSSRTSGSYGLGRKSPPYRDLNQGLWFCNSTCKITKGCIKSRLQDVV